MSYPESCRMPPYQHQLEDTRALVLLSDPKIGRHLPGCMGNYSDMGVGKTKILIDTAMILFEGDAIDEVVVVCPSSCRRGVWTDPDLGELRKHLWEQTPATVTEFHSKKRSWHWGALDSASRLIWTVSNYEFVRNIICTTKRDSRDRDDRGRMLEDELVSHCGPRTLLVLDESGALKSHKAKQTKACAKLRRLCGRVVEFNGTPIDNNPGDAYSQAAILDPRILGFKSYFHFLGEHAVKGGYMNKEVVSWRNLEQLRAKMAPYVIRRMKEDCLDLPPKLPPVTLTATLAPATWAMYKQLRDEFMVWLTEATTSEAAQAGVRAMRLAQITSGFLGGLIEVQEDGSEVKLPARQIGTEKLEVAINWIIERVAEDLQFKLLVWCRFRDEIARLTEALPSLGVQHVGNIWGGQTRDDRDHALRLLDPKATPDGSCVVVGTPASGALGLNLTASHHILRVSRDYRLSTFLQGNDRIHRSGQLHPCWFGDIVAEGPKGQRTIDHVVVQALRDKSNLAEWTTSAWITHLEGLDD